MCTKQQSLSKIRQIARLKDNWNGYRASGGRAYPINKAITVLEIISTLEEKYGDDIYPDVFPTARDSIQFEWNIPEHYLEFEVQHQCLSLMRVIGKDYNNAFQADYSYDKPSEPFRILERYLSSVGFSQKE